MASQTFYFPDHEFDDWVQVSWDDIKLLWTNGILYHVTITVEYVIGFGKRVHLVH